MKKGQKAEASLGILDTQSIKWGNHRSLNNYDGNKKVKGIKRHVIEDKNGFLIAVMITATHIHNSKAVMLLMRKLKEMLSSIKIIVASGGYCGEIAGMVKKSFIYIIQVVMRSDDKKSDLSQSI